MKSLSLLALAATALLPATSLAQSFEGPYAGVQIGWNNDRAPLPDGAATSTQERDSFVGGIYAGYDHAVADNVVLGVEGGFQIGVDDRISGANNLVAVDQRYAFDISTRAGYVVGDSTLAYVRGGYSNSRVRLSDVSATGYETENLDGWFVGGGVEHKLINNVSARLEYRYHQYDFDEDDLERHQVLAGVSYRF
ncbi:outer membrane protein [Alteraurantiacibacter aquimixticola]|uniref:Porin family protein n=1 Tax=Alteraurantiacibacter aquimixticola TaxID=2489173 RepID=A0A4T3F338_9SPHN|nr:porin family protein [Alteraurantiacibacter aquimixticola]TIX51151.1 porin family protein [Alteraurantiacibacter aquimixticola]